MWRYILQRVLTFIPTSVRHHGDQLRRHRDGAGRCGHGDARRGWGNEPGRRNWPSLRAKYGLDDPLPIRYARWMGQLAAGQPGHLSDRQPARCSIHSRHTVGLTLEFTLPAFVIGLALAIVLGAWSGFRPYSGFDRAVSFGSMIVIATPSFVLALLALYVLAVRLPILPAGGNRDMLGADATSLVRRLPYFVLPVYDFGVADRSRNYPLRTRQRDRRLRRRLCAYGARERSWPNAWC